MINKNRKKNLNKRYKNFSKINVKNLIIKLN